MKSTSDLQLGTTTYFTCIIKVVSLFLVTLFSAFTYGQISTFTASGTYTVPAGATAIKVECWGAGGGGSTITSNGRRGGGGGGGAYATSVISTTAGTSYNVVVGAGGAANTSGGNSTFNSTTVVAAGGTGGTSNSTTGGAGGTTAASTGTTKYAGGAGANGGSTYSGGGGGGAGSTGAGGSASGQTAGTGTTLNGGAGGTGVSGSSDGNPGNTYGGGGSGAVTNSATDRFGGIGAGGLVVVTVLKTVEVIATLGSTAGYYTTLKGAFDKINDGTHRGVITIKINDNSTETASASLNASGSGSASYTSVTIYPTASGLSISGSITTPLIQLNGADYVTLDGRVNQSGFTDLLLSNTSTGTGARTIELINSAQNNNIQYCTVKGAGATTTQGIINFSTATSGTGNDGNYISYCNITGTSSTNRAVNAICSLGSTGYENSENTIRNNNIYDFLMPGTASNGIFISSYSTGFAITGNSFYETASFAPTASVEYAAIRIDNTAGNDFSVQNNYIGGNAASCSGTWTKTNAFNNTFNGIYLNLGSTNNSVQNNTIQGFVYSNSGAANWNGIYVAGGAVNVGTSVGNTIGAITGSGSISFTAGATGAIFNGICIAGTSTVTCSNNSVGSITAAASTGTNATNFYGIYKTATAGTTTINNNFIGSATTANSINTSSAATGNSQILYGIYSLGTGTITISGNTVQNLTNSTTETTLASRTRGIFSNAGVNSITSNTVSNLKTGGLSNGTNYDNAAIIGIATITTGAGNDVSGNTVHDLETNATGKIEMYGIYYNGPASGTNTISRNFVYSYIVPGGGSTGSYLHGISLYAGNYTASNNIVYLGNNISIGCSIWGIWTGSTGAVKIYHNTIYLTGTATSGTSNSFAFRSLNCPSSADIRNNILWDGRTNSSGVISHYAIYLNCITNLTIDYNDYQFAQQFGTAAGTTYNTFTAWQTAFNIAPNYNEAHSLNVDPQLINLGGTTPYDYQTNIQLQGVTGTGITTDYESVTRVTPTMGAWEFFTNPVEIWNGTTYRNAYPTLKAAFDVINAGTYTGDMIIKFRGNTTETASAVLNASGVGSASYTHILVYPARGGITVTGNLAAPMVDVNGADNIDFDGRINGSGASYEFFFINTSTSATSGTSTFRYINSAESDTIRYCVIKGASTATVGGNIYFATATSGNGNDNNVILNNKITSVNSSNRPVNAIYSSGTSTFENSSNAIQNNLIYDVLNQANASSAINIGSNSTAFTVSGNSFYETTAFAPIAGVDYSVINVNNTSGNSFVISENYIGGSASGCSGTWSKSGGYSNVFYGINLNAGASTSSSIQGNVIKNINYNNTGATNWYGINIAAGDVNVGTTSGNTIGAATGTGSVTVTNTTSGGVVYGINIASGSNVDCQYNTIASVTATNASANATNLYGINKTATAGTTTISHNTIGSTTTSNSFNASGTSTGNAQSVYGIYSAGTGVITIQENVIANLNNATTNTTTSTTGRINGILVSSGSTNTLSKNTVRNLSIANANNTTGSTASVVGMALTGTGATRTISDNTIYGLSNSFTNYAGSVVGLYYEGSTSGTNVVRRSFIHSLSTPNNGTANGTNLIGIQIASGVTTYSNNIVNLGVSGTTNRNIMYGIYDTGAASQTCNLYFNTVYLAGTEAGNNNSATLYSAANSNTRDYENNILFNARTGGTGAHYAVYFNYTSGGSITSNYNDYYTTGTTSYLARYNNANDNTIPFITGQDANSLNLNPSFNSAGSTVATDYKVAITLAGTNISSVTVDYGLNARPGSAPTMGAWESNANKWKGTTSDDWNTASNWTGNLVPAVDATIQFDDVPLHHCVMDQNRSVMNIINAQSTYRIVTNGHKLTVKGDFFFTNGAQIDATSTTTNMEFAGASAQTIPAGSFYNDAIYDLTINNANNVTLNGTLRLLNTITATSGKLDANTYSPTVSYAGSSSQSIEDARYLNNKAYDLIIDNAVGVNLNTDFTVSNNLTINSGKKLTISVANQMLVQGTVTNSAGTSGLIIKSSSVAPTGSFIYYNSSGNPVQATVEMYSKAFWNLSAPSGSRYKWQYFGLPITKVKADPAFYGAYVRKWVESGTTTANHWIQLANTDSVYSFKGYELVQAAGKTYSFSGTLVNSNYSSGQLAYTSTALYPGQHVLGNPYTAGIDIRQLNFGSDMEMTVYLYNSGSYNDWYTTGGDANVGTNPGQYTAAPKNLAGYSGIPRQIPSMQGFLVKAMSNSANATLSIPYSSAMMKNTDLQRAPRKVASALATDIASTLIEVKGSRFSDRMWLFSASGCTRNFDNGWDGPKSFGTSASVPQIFASESDGDYQTDVVDDMNNTTIGFYSGEDSIYTLTFTHENVENNYPTLYLVDLQKDTTIDIVESGTQYSFLVKSTDTLVNRFKIITSTGITTETVKSFTESGLKVFGASNKAFIHNATEKSGNFLLYDVSGQLVLNRNFGANAITTVDLNLPAGIYVGKGVSGREESISRFIIK